MSGSAAQMPNTSQEGSRLGFRISDELSEKIARTIEQVRSDPRRKEHVTALVDLVLELTDAGLLEYYLRPLEEARAGAIARTTAKAGISTARRGISVIVNKLLRSLSAGQLLSIADSMESFLIREPSRPPQPSPPAGS